MLDRGLLAINESSVFGFFPLDGSHAYGRIRSANRVVRLVLSNRPHDECAVVHLPHEVLMTMRFSGGDAAVLMKLAAHLFCNPRISEIQVVRFKKLIPLLQLESLYIRHGGIYQPAMQIQMYHPLFR